MAKKVDLLLVNPSDKKQTYGKLGDNFAGIEPPIWTALLAAVVREKKFDVSIIDMDAEDFSPEDTVAEIRAMGPLLVGIAAVGPNPSASSTPKMAAVRVLLELLNASSFKGRTFLYGIHPSALPERTLHEEKVDFTCKGEPFIPIPMLINALNKDNEDEIYKIKGICFLKENKFYSNGWADTIENLDNLPMAAWDMLPMDRYRTHNWHCFGRLQTRGSYAVIYTSLGCPYNCRYCNIHALYGGSPSIRYRDVRRVVEEIDLLVNRYGISNLKIMDELFVLHEERVNQMCDLLLKRNYQLNIWAYARVDTVNTAILKKLKAAGVNWLCFGIESASKRVRAGVTKGRFDENAIESAIKMTHDAGIYVIGNFMFGLPDDDLETMRATFKLAQKLKCEYVNFYATMAYPGSQLYHDALEKGIPLPVSWGGYSQFNTETLPLPTKYLTATRVLRFRDSVFMEYFSNPSYLKMIEQVFGSDTRRHVEEMLKNKIHRSIIEENDETKSVF